MDNMDERMGAEKKLTAKKVIREIISWLLWIAGAVALAFIVKNTIIVNAKVISGSMEKTIMTDDKVLGNRLAYVFGEPQRFDVIMFLWPDNPDDLPFVKRIIGLPGETVEVYGGKIYIDGVYLDDTAYLYEEMRDKMDYARYEVPEESYFVLGDNRNGSIDSRDWRNTYVPRENILGKVFLRFYPSIGRIR